MEQWAIATGAKEVPVKGERGKDTGVYVEAPDDFRGAAGSGRGLLRLMVVG